ncbi:MAG: hypothetical protein FRX48_09631 [Lasallia pustulata]|uniref:Uncharacterized protein n=1 Tax=Lasallia pustulata TaxID=136370 RepID=A0A5M8PC56_9LECA|nr:MAG: hypothetical protein FRX48_09631 [Lasallia pustulata]
MPFLRTRYGSRIDIPLGMPAEEAFAEACQHLDVRPSYKARYLYYRIGSIRAMYTNHPVFCGEDQELFLHTSPSRVAISWKVLSPLLFCVVLAAFALHYAPVEGTIPLYLSSTAGTLSTLCAMSLMFIPWHEVGILLKRDKIYGRYGLRSYITRDSLSMKLPQ